jgi:predicted nucleotidyltransferase
VDDVDKKGLFRQMNLCILNRRPMDMIRNLESIPSPYKELIIVYYNAIQKHFGKRLYSICLYGSVARGDANPRSDIDLLVIAADLPPDFGSRSDDTFYIHTMLSKSKEYRRLKDLGHNAMITDIFLHLKRRVATLRYLSI